MLLGQRPALLSLLIGIDKRIEPLKRVDQLARQTQIGTLQPFQVLLVLGQLPTDAQGLQSDWFRDRFDLLEERGDEFAVFDEALPIFRLAAGCANRHHNVFLTK